MAGAVTLIASMISRDDADAFRAQLKIPFVCECCLRFVKFALRGDERGAQRLMCCGLGGDIGAVFVNIGAVIQSSLCRTGLALRQLAQGVGKLALQTITSFCRLANSDLGGLDRSELGGLGAAEEFHGWPRRYRT